MPRTSRRTATTGLVWEALAPLVRWPLHSPRRLASLLAALVAIGWLVATLGPSGAADPAPTTPPSSVTSSTSPTAPPAASLVELVAGLDGQRSCHLDSCRGGGLVAG